LVVMPHDLGRLHVHWLLNICRLWRVLLLLFRKINNILIDISHVLVVKACLSCRWRRRWSSRLELILLFLRFVGDKLRSRSGGTISILVISVWWLVRKYAIQHISLLVHNHLVPLLYWISFHLVVWIILVLFVHFSID
jgi:hypothetical protein